MSNSKKEFIAEAEDLLQESQRLILEIQDSLVTDINPDTINAPFRAMHGLKGVAGLFGLQGISRLSHALEALMDDVRLGKIDVTDAIVAFLFRNVDILRSLVEGVSNEQENDDVAAYLSDIENFRNSQKGQAEAVPAESVIDPAIMRVLSEYEEHRLKANIKEGKGVYLAKAVFSLDIFDTALESMTKTIKTLGELISTLPTSSNVPDGFIGFNLMFGSLRPLDELRKEINVEIEQLSAPKLSPQPPAAVPVADGQTLFIIRNRVTFIYIKDNHRFN